MAREGEFRHAAITLVALITAGLMCVVPLADAAPFPPVFPLGSLLSRYGGDGSAGFVIGGIQQHNLTGWSISAAGDVNGDGIDDLIVGAPWDDAGRSYVVFGSTQGFPAVLPLARLWPGGGGDGSAGFVLTGIDSWDYAGFVSDAGDVNGDGIGDLIVGATGADVGGHARVGEAYVVFGRSTTAAR